MSIATKINAWAGHLVTLADYWLRHRRYMEQQISQLRSRKTGDTAFLIATGPSIKRQNLALLQGQDCFTISNAYLHKDIGAINPVAHGFAAYHHPMDRQNYVQWLQQALEKLPSSTSIYTDHSNKAVVAESGIGASRSVVYGLYDSAARRLWPKYCKYLFLPPQSGPLLMLPLIMAMGYRRICLLGCDHTTMRDYGGYITNFYDKTSDVRKHATDPSVWPDIKTELWANIRLFEQYDLYAGWARMLQIEILNLSDDSWVRQFPFSTIESVMACKK